MTQKIPLETEGKFNLPPDVRICLRAYIESMAEIRVLIVDDVERVRQDLRTFLTLAGDIQVVGEAGDGREAIRLAEILSPQVILMDLEMPVLDGYEAIRLIKGARPACRMIALSIHEGPAEQDKARRAGADDFIAKGEPLHSLMDSIHKISKGDRT